MRLPILHTRKKPFPASSARTEPTVANIYTMFALTLSLPAILLANAAFVDHNAVIEGPGVGLLEDWNILVMFAAFPIELVSLHLVWRRLHDYRDSIPRLVTSAEPATIARLASALDQAVESPAAGSLRYRIFQFLVIAGCWAFLLFNAYNRYYRPHEVYFTSFWTSGEFKASYWLTNCYTVLVWGIAGPFIVLKLAKVLWSISRINAAMREEPAVQLILLSPDNAGGLRSLGHLALLMSAMAVPVQFQVVAYYFWIPAINPPFLIGAAAAVIATVALFAFPVGLTHRTMRFLKERMLGGISDEFNRLYREAFLQRRGDSPRTLVGDWDAFDALRELHATVTAVRTWPFEFGVLVGFLGAVVAPSLPVVLELLLAT